MTVKSAEIVSIEADRWIPRVTRRSFDRNYTLTGSELSVETIEMFDLGRREMVTSLVLYHENLGNVTLSVGNEADPDALIQSELASAVGTGWLGQGVSDGLAPQETAGSLIVVRMTLNSGAYVAGAKIQMWATVVRVSG